MLNKILSPCYTTFHQADPGKMPTGQVEFKEREISVQMEIPNLTIIRQRITAMGKPPFKASEGGHYIMWRAWKDVAFGEFRFVNGYGVLFL